jgi:hypothetical protein
MNLNSVEDYIKVLREGDMKLAGEENFKAKNGTWKSSILQKIDGILKTGQNRWNITYRARSKISCD